MTTATTAARYQQTTKSREAYEAQQLAFLHRPLTASASRRSRPKSAGAGSWNGSRDRPGGGGGGTKESSFPSPPAYPPPAYYPAPGAGGSGHGGGAPRGHPPPAFGRRVSRGSGSSANGGDPRGARPGKPRTRVRPSSANARVYGTPGAGQGVGVGAGGGGGVGHNSSGTGGIPRGEYVPRYAAGYGVCAAGSDRSKAASGGSQGQYRSHSPTPAATQGTSTTPPSRLQAPPRPKSAAARHPDSTTAPPPAPPLPAPSTGGDSKGAGVPEVKRVKNAPPGGAAGGGEPATAAVPPGDAAAGRTEFRGADHGGGEGSSARRSHRRPRPRSAVARVETASHHGKMATTTPVPTTAATRAAVAVTTKLKAAAAAVAFATHRGSSSSSGGNGVRGSGNVSRASGGPVGRTRVAPRPQSAAMKRSTVTGTYGQRSQRESMERVMARIFQQQRHWAGEQGGKKGIIEGNPKTRQARHTRRPQSARTAPPYSTAAAVAAKEQQQQQAHHPNPKPHTWVPATPAKTSSALMAAAAAAAAAAAVAATRSSPNSGGKHSGGKHSHAVVGGEGKTSTAPATGRGGAYARLFGMKHPGAHRRVGVDPLDGFKKDHYRGSAAAAAAVDASALFSGDIGGVKHGQGARVEEVSKPRKPDGDTNAVETQATISTANTGSLTPPEGSSSAEGGRTAGEGGIRAPPPVEPLTKASAECCSPQERLYLRRLLLDLQGSARSSLDFYRLGKVVGEGSFAQVRVAWHKLTGQRVAVKTYEKAKIKDDNQWKRISQEVKLMEKLNHPRVIRLFETAESSKRIHLVMEYADGGNLCSYVKRRKRLDEGEARRILRQLLEGVDYMHGLDIVHRDIKLENVLLGGSGRSNAKLVDFGFSANVKNRRLLHVFCGTPSYMPPEIIKRQEYEGKPVDVWSLGVVLYAMLCGCFPFSGPRYPELYKNISKGVFRLPDWLSPAAISLVRGMLVTDPSRRLTLRQVCAHPWVLPPRATGRVSTGNQYRGLAASDGGAVADESQSSRIPHDSLGSSTPLKRDSFHISNDPTRDICAASVKKMEAFGANGEEVARQVLARRHSCLTTTFYLLRNELSTNGGAAEVVAPRPASATSSSSRGAAKPRHANVRPSSASGDNWGGAGVGQEKE